MAASTLVNVSEYVVAVGDTNEDTAHLQKLDLLLKWASTAVRNYTDRDFGSETVTEARTFVYEGERIVELDDLTAATAVSLDGVSLTSDYWRLGPQNSTDNVYYWIEVPPFSGASTALGFKENLDVLGLPPLRTISVTGDWGWPEVPNDVKQAVVWTMGELLSDQSAYNSESLAEYSYARGGGGPAFLPEAIPQRAQRLLEHYRRIAL